MRAARGRVQKEQILFIDGQTAQPATVTLNCCVTETCCLPSLVLPSAPSVVTPVCDSLRCGNETREWIRLEGDGWINRTDVCRFPLLDGACNNSSGRFLSFFYLSLDLILEILCDIYSLLSFFVSAARPFLSHPFFCDFSGDGPAKASPIILLEQPCSLTLFYQRRESYLLRGLDHTNTGQLCLFQLRQKIYHISIHTHTQCSAKCGPYRSLPMSSSQDNFQGD